MNSHLSTLNSNLSIKNTDSEIVHLSDFHSRMQVFLTNERKSCPQTSCIHCNSAKFCDKLCTIARISSLLGSFLIAKSEKSKRNVLFLDNDESECRLMLCLNALFTPLRWRRTCRPTFRCKNLMCRHLPILRRRHS